MNKVISIMLAVLTLTVYTPKDRNKFPAGSDAWYSLDSGCNIALDDMGFIVNEGCPASAISGEFDSPRGTL